ncbi:MAG: hypothetical protein ACRC56_09565 [Bosea sp. (in: a-proteobacteria)]
MSRKIVSVVFAAAAFVAAFASPAMVTSASAQWPGQYSYPGGSTADVPHAVPVAPAFHGGPHYGPPRGYGHGHYGPPRHYGYGHHRRWHHRHGPPPWAYGPPRPRYYHW